MGSDRALRGCMQVLVLLDLAFVWMTGAASLHWLLPLFGLTLAAPLFARWRESLAYVVLWNGGVLAFFLVLLRHALQADLAFVREDGLVLAALCQVHLLNNLRSSQRPDLLFFNAFLIAIMAAFMTSGLGFPLAFLAFAPAFVVALQLQSATRGGRVLPAAATARLVRDAVRRAGWILAATLVVFLLVPRDFERRAFLHGRLELAENAPAVLEIGFNEELVLHRSGTVEESDAEALRVTLVSGKSDDVPLLWRGATLGATSGEEWRPLESRELRANGRSDEPWRRRGAGLVRAGSHAAGGPRVAVRRADIGTERLFAPLGARALDPERDDVLLRPRADGTVDGSESGELAYTLVLAAPGAEAPGGARPAELPDALAPYVDLPDDPSIAAARDLAARLAAEVPAEVDQHVLVERFSGWLARRLRYLPPGADGAADTLEGFLAGRGGGHCEFFAAALATMLRSQAIPCRVVTGLRGARWDARGRVLVLGTRDAHAWVEVHDPRAGWMAVDPSPLLAEHEGGRGPWASTLARARSWWRGVTGFDAERRAALFAWLRAAPGRLGSALAARPAATLASLAALAGGLWLLAVRRRARVAPTVRAWLRAARRAGLRPRADETPRELLERARTIAEASEARLAALERAMHRHEAERYAAREAV